MFKCHAEWEEFFDQPSDCHLLNEDFTLWNDIPWENMMITSSLYKYYWPGWFLSFVRVKIFLMTFWLLLWIGSCVYVCVFKLTLFKISVIQGGLFTFQKSCPCKSGTPVHCKYREQGNGRSLWIWNSKTFSIWVSICIACVNYGVNAASELLIPVSLHC